MVDIGSFHKDPKGYQKLVEKLYKDYPNITLPPEYGYFFEKDLLRLLIRLARYKFIARLIKKTDLVLEVGSGSGLGSIFMSQHCVHVTGLDVKTTEVEEARLINRRENIEFIAGDFFEMKIEKKYDVIVSLDVIEHMPTKKGHQLLKTMAQHLKSNGMAVIGTPSVYSYDYQSPLSKASHVKCYDQEELDDLVENYFCRALTFSMNDEMIHTGHPKMAWYYFVLGFYPKSST